MLGIGLRTGFPCSQQAHQTRLFPSNLTLTMHLAPRSCEARPHLWIPTLLLRIAFIAVQEDVGAGGRGRGSGQHGRGAGAGAPGHYGPADQGTTYVPGTFQNKRKERGGGTQVSPVSIFSLSDAYLLEGKLPTPYLVSYMIPMVSQFR